MNHETFDRVVYPALLVLWLAAFAAEAAGIVGWSSAMSETVERLDSSATALDQGARELSGLTRQSRDLSRELEFLQTLPNLLPKDKGYLRTQKAISEEAQALRGKVWGRLKGSVYVLIDAKANKLYLRRGTVTLWEADCSVGRGGTLFDKKTGRRWEFVTPRGEFRVLGKAQNPLWKKPDWAYVETGEAIPPPDDPERQVSGELGPYVLNLGDGYLIHGTKNEDLLGRPASHGCVRLGAGNLTKLYQSVPVGTKVFIFY